MNNTPEHIINQIESELTENNEKNREIILENMRKYSEHEYGQEIVLELSMMLCKYLSPEEIEKFEKALQSDIPEMSLLDSVTEDFSNENYDDAFNKLDDYMKNEPKRFVDDETTEYHVLSNNMEETLFEEYIEPEKEVQFVSPEIPLADLNFLYAFLLIERNELDEAEKYLKIALNYDPVSNQILFELIDLYKKKEDWDSVHDCLQKTFTYIYTPEYLARYYRDLGFYYAETGNPEIAVALYIHSLKYHNYDAAYHELDYLKNNGQNIEVSPYEAQKVLEENDIPLVANPFIVNEYRECGDRYGEEEELEEALEMYTMAYMLDDSLENQMRYKIAESALNDDKELNITL